MSKGGIVGILGGVIALVGAFLPWWNVNASAGGIISVSVPVLGILTLGGILVLVFGVLGVVFAALKKPVMEILALVMGLLVIVMSLMFGALFPTASVSVGGAASASITAGFGYWISLVGGLLLIVGGALGFMEARKAPAGPMPMSPQA